MLDPNLDLDTFELTEPLDFVRLGPDDYALSCP